MIRTSHSCPALLFAIVSAAPLAAQLHWVDAQPPQSPAPRYGHAASFQYLVFGGRDATQVFSDTWAYGTDGVVGDTWNLVPATTTPPGRYDHAVAGRVGGMMVFGGLDLAGNRFGDTWMLDGSWVGGPPHQWLGDWQQVATNVAPSPRNNHAIAYDWMTNTECLLFGGRTDSGLNGETWMFANGQWQQLSPVDAPTPREGHTLVADADSWILFGGNDANGASSETWRFDGSNWQQVTDMPFAASDMGVSWVSFERRRFSFVGGTDANGAMRTAMFERTTDGEWFEQETLGNLTPRTDAIVVDHLHFVVDSPNQFRAAALVFGGRDANGQALGDTQLLLQTHAAEVERVSTGCGPGGWGNSGPEVLMQDLILGATKDLSVYTRSADVPVFLGAQAGDVGPGPNCTIGIVPEVVLFGVATSPIQPPVFGSVIFPIHAPFDPALRGIALSFQSLAFEPEAANGLSLSGVVVARIGD